MSREWIMSFLSQPEYRSPLAPLVRPRRPFTIRKLVDRDVLSLASMARDVDKLSNVIADIEPDGKGVPILLKQYLKLGAKSLAFNVDPAFNRCLDCLCVFDILQTEQRVVERYMGKEESREFLAVLRAHRASPCAPAV
jgi:hypothetical protein